MFEEQFGEAKMIAADGRKAETRLSTLVGIWLAVSLMIQGRLPDWIGARHWRNCGVLKPLPCVLWVSSALR